MFTTNPFADLVTTIPLDIIQGYVVLMAILVVGGTALDMIHKKSAQYFFENGEKLKADRERVLGARAPRELEEYPVAAERAAGQLVRVVRHADVETALANRLALENDAAASKHHATFGLGLLGRPATEDQRDEREKTR